jgi:phospholipase/carboxylesterase
MSKLLPSVEINPVGEIKASVIWLHGLGADGHDFEPIVPQLRLPPAFGIRFVFPHAPRRPVTINGGFVMRAWYDILTPDLSQRVDEAGMQESERAVLALIEREIAQGVAPARIILAGFSQGGVIALDVAVRYPKPLGGIIALSGYVAQPDQIPAPARPIPIFMGHGTQDPIVPFALGVQSRRFLEAKGYKVDWHDYPMPHCVCTEEIAAIRSWLVDRLAVGEKSGPAL